MGQLWAALDAAWRVLLIGLVFGAGLPAVFAYGVRALAWGTGGEASLSDGAGESKPHPVGKVIAYTVFVVVILIVLAGIGFIIAHGLGWSISFNPWPVITPKH